MPVSEHCGFPEAERGMMATTTRIDCRWRSPTCSARVSVTFGSSTSSFSATLIWLA